MEEHQNEPKRKKQKRSIGIAYLPTEIIDLIVYYIPDDYLERYVDIPILGYHAIKKLYRCIAIVSSYSQYRDGFSPEPKEFKYITTTEEVEHNVLRESLDKFSGLHIKDRKRLTVNEFIQLIKKFPGFTPELLEFSGMERFIWLHKRYPHILKRLPRIALSFLLDDKRVPKPVIFDQYNIYSVSDLPGVILPDTSILSKISSLRTHNLPELVDKTWGENLQELRCKGIAEFDVLFPNLKKLILHHFVDLHETGLPRLPSTLQLLQITVCSIDQLDLSYLESLRVFVADCMSGVDRLSRFKFPRGIERIMLSGSDHTTEVANLESIESYPNLKEFKITVDMDEETEVLAFSESTTFPESLQKLDLFVHESTVEDLSPRPLVEIDEKFRFPADLKVLQVAASKASYNLDEWTLPPSLMGLVVWRFFPVEYETDNKYESEKVWWESLFSDSLIEIRLSIPVLNRISAPFPKSVRSLDLQSLNPIESMDFSELENLYQLRIRCDRMNNFVCKLPSNLKTLDLSNNVLLSKVIIEAPSLTNLELTNTSLEWIISSNFQIPNSVEVLSLTVPESEPDGSRRPCKLVKIEPNILPTSLRELYLRKSAIACDFLHDLQLHNCKNLVKLDLSGNKIYHLQENQLPLSLEWISLDGNPISSFCSPEVFTPLTKLRHLSMASTKINEYLQSESGRLLKFPSSLLSLDLSDNNLQPGMGNGLIVSDCVRLQEFCLVGNKDLEDVQAIVNVIKARCPNMVELLLDSSLREHVNEKGIRFLSYYSEPIFSLYCGPSFL
ncbi:uncharacterized protein J8A68_000407 [[Candida] subhashii]|uniref:Uncharacterized protein n=1 Tax=[Candida] subhashii TaxID=561895 RepID=A0A8J5QTF5_9ASCO|nr:uncharacterized protein J8A68_000407 [[Candida] subhashii]KAG7665978.1 hypothetical protein J8A68_000407 [[Candida] subhashii]